MELFTCEGAKSFSHVKAFKFGVKIIFLGGLVMVRELHNVLFFFKKRKEKTFAKTFYWEDLVSVTFYFFPFTANFLLLFMGLADR